MSDSGRTTFIEDVLEGHALLDDIEDYIDAWHDAPRRSWVAQTEIYEFLGMSWEEYRLWGERPVALRFILAAHEQGVPVESIVRSASAQPVAARAEDASAAQKVLDWLRKTGRIDD